MAILYRQYKCSCTSCLASHVKVLRLKVKGVQIIFPLPTLVRMTFTGSDNKHTSFRLQILTHILKITIESFLIITYCLQTKISVDDVKLLLDIITKGLVSSSITGGQLMNLVPDFLLTEVNSIRVIIVFECSHHILNIWFPVVTFSNKVK